MESSLMSALQHRPERLDAVGMGHAVHVLADRVLDAFMRVRNALVGYGVIGIDNRVRLGIFGHEALQRFSVGVLDHLGVNLVRGAVLRADYRHHVHRAAARRRLALGVRHVLALPANIGFVKFDRPVERALAIVRPGFPDAMQHEPCRRLGNAKIAFQLHGRNRLEVCQAKVNSYSPLAQRYFRPLHGRTGLDAEVGAAIRTPIRHLDMRGFAGSNRSAFRAMATIRPDDGFKPRGRRFLGREHVHQLDDGESLAMGFSGCFLRHFRSPFLPLKYREET